MVDIEYLGGAQPDDVISEAERDVISYISETDRYENILSRDDRWDVFYHLSPMRESLFNWVDFTQGCSLLELGCEMGALTSLFCRKCGHVTAIDWLECRARAVQLRNRAYGNLSVCVGDIAYMEQERRYDYIVLMPAYYKTDLGKMLKAAKGLLKDNGSLFVVVPNKIGVDVMAGGTQGKEQRPFQSLRQGSGYYSLSEAEELIAEAAFTETKIFYPVPDHIVPQEIYSEDYLPHKNRTDRLLYYYPSQKNLMYRPALYMEESIKNGFFEKCANSFLIECGMQSRLSGISYAALSTDRNRAAAYATKIYGRERVRKEALFPEGRAGIKGLYENLGNLADRGLDVIPQEMSGSADTLEMPYCAQPLLIRHIEENSDTLQEMERIFDELERLILQSSEHAPADSNALREHAPLADWGPILRYAYIDMIPLNCFWENGRISFFDQEFCRENYPAKYVMFRVLRYTFLSLRGMGKPMDLEHFKNRYRLAELWDIFMEEEDRFIYQNRNHSVYGNFYEWTELSEETLDKNIRRLSEGVIDDPEFQEKIDDPEIQISFSDNFYQREEADYGHWRWSNTAHGKLLLQYLGKEALQAEIGFYIGVADTLEHRKTDIYLDGKLWSSVIAPVTVTIPIKLFPGQRVVLEICGNFQRVTVPGDDRVFFFEMLNYSVREEPQYVSEDVKPVRSRQMELLKRLKRVCGAYDLQYFAIYGTLLGAIRNQGYLPWDDDIDIALLREDYDTLAELARTKHIFGDNCFWQDFFSERGAFYGGYSKLRWTDMDGVCLDIFPLDNCADEPKRFNRQHRRIRFYQSLLYHKSYGRKGKFSENNPWKWYMQILGWIFTWRYLSKRLDRNLRLYHHDKSCRKVAVLARCIPQKDLILFDRECFRSAEDRRFQHMIIKVPERYDECLRSIYGYNYMVYPPESARIPRHEPIAIKNSDRKSQM